MSYIYSISCIGYLKMTRSFLVLSIKQFFQIFTGVLILGNKLRTIEVVSFFLAMLGVFLFAIPNEMAADELFILGSAEREIYHESRALAKTSPDMIFKGGLSNEGIS